MRVFRRLGLFSLGMALCACTQSDGTPADAGALAGDADSDRDAGSGDDAEAAANPGAVPGTCRAVHLADVVASNTFWPAPPVVRTRDALVLGPWREQAEDRRYTLRWKVIAEDGTAVQELSSSPDTMSLQLLPFEASVAMGAALNHAVVVYDDSSAATFDTISTRVFAANGGPGEAHALGTAFQRGSAYGGHVVSLDGARAFYAAGHVAVDIPHGYLFDEQGIPVGAELRLAGPEADSLFGCASVIPTRHAAAFSVIDRAGDSPMFRLAELDRDGLVVQRIDVEASELVYSDDTGQACPLIQLARDGLLVAARTAAGIALYRVRDGALTRIDFAIPEDWSGTAARWLGEDEHGQVRMLISDAQRVPRMAYLTAEGTWRFFEGSLPGFNTVVLGEPERLFVDETAGRTHSLHEIVCMP